MEYFVVNGYPKSGKDTFMELCSAHSKAIVRCISIVDFIKDLALEFGWNFQKTPKDRKFLAELKNLLEEWNDVPFQKTCEDIEQFEWELDSLDIADQGMVLICAREPKDIERFKQKYNARTILIRRQEVTNDKQSNAADSGVENYNYDFIIDNNSTIEELSKKTKEFLKNN